MDIQHAIVGYFSLLCSFEEGEGRLRREGRLTVVQELCWEFTCSIRRRRSVGCVGRTGIASRYRFVVACTSRVVWTIFGEMSRDATVMAAALRVCGSARSIISVTMLRSAMISSLARLIKAHDGRSCDDRSKNTVEEHFTARTYMCSLGFDGKANAVFPMALDLHSAS